MFLLLALLLILGGAAALLSPALQRPGPPLSVQDALFTATSALCGSGLTVIDLGARLNVGGQVLVLLLVQLGGLGIMIFGTLFMVLARRRPLLGPVGLGTRASAPEVGSVRGLLMRMLRFVLLAEGVGAALLSLRFVPEYGLWQGLYLGLFHAVMAFNNAGFSPLHSSLRPYAADPLVSSVLPLLMVTGGLGVLVLLNVAGHLRRPRQVHLSVQSKVAVWSVLVLLLGGSVLVAALEWHNPRTLGPLPVGGKLLSSIFQAATARTSGLSTLDTGALRPATWLLLMALMFVGASSGSTGGGVKTSTVFVLLGSAWSTLRGRSEVVLFRRRVDEPLTLRASAVVCAALLLILAGTLALVALNTSPRLDLTHLGFEAVSAFSTTGLTLGATPDTNPAQRTLLMLLMVLGRLGPLILGHALLRRARPADVSYPAERDMLIG